MALHTGTIDQSASPHNTYKQFIVVEPTLNTLTVTVSAEGSDSGDVVVTDYIGIVLLPNPPGSITGDVID